MILTIFKKMLYILIGLVALFLLIGFLFISFSPQFGKSASKEQKAEYQKLAYYKDGKFVNLIKSEMNIEFFKLMGQYINPVPNKSPAANIEVLKIDSLEIVENRSQDQITWFGHSAFLLELDSKKILLDPMFGNSPAPHPWLGPKRYSKELPIEIEKIPFIDYVLFSHDHYDHLDYGSVMLLKEKVGAFYVPLGLGNHLESWGVEKSKIHELAWWDEIKVGDIQLACTPARHFSGRGLFDRESTLWCSWVIKSDVSAVYFSGDGGYGPHFKEIGEKYGPFDLSLMECGQYNEQWQAIHMLPEETVQAAMDVNSKRFMPIHWGAFTLSLHAWTEPVERAGVKAEELSMSMSTPRIGEVMTLDSVSVDYKKWWLSL